VSATLLGLVIAFVVMAMATWLVARACWRHGATARALFVLTAIAGLATLGTRGVSVLAESPEQRDLRDVAYETSSACQKCHAAEYASWYRTFHRTMTQEATPETVIGDFDDVVLQFYGHPVRLYRDGAEFFMELVDWGWEKRMIDQGIDPATVRNAPRRHYRIDRVVGSNQMQVYLYRTPEDTYVALPLEWNNREKRWVTAAGNYLQPPNQTPWLFAHVATWNETCIFCHNTRPNPGVRTAEEFYATGKRFQSHVEELGIACEACHGPSAEHEAANRDPVRRYTRQGRGAPDPTIIHPARLDQQASLELCGRCHGKFGIRPEYRDLAFREGDPFVPAHAPLGEHYREPHERAGGDHGRMGMEGYFWPDGTPRPTAMEYQGVKLSPCAQRGPMTCLSCHSMHDADPVDQLRFADDPTTAEFEDDQACIQCHDAYRDSAYVGRHTRHEATSEGSRCVNCHMPFATFGLMKTVRTHRVMNPDAHLTATTRLPNGCNQCHTDQTLGWTAKWLQEWYGAPPLDPLGDELDALALTAVDLLSGHALNRALAAASLGWEPAMQAAPGDWAVPLLLAALEDDYAAVRLNAWVALRTREGLDPSLYDYLAPAATRAAAIAKITNAWRERSRDALPAQLPIDPAEGLDPRWKRILVQNRDRTPLTILE
jgi:hypothetical protein